MGKRQFSIVLSLLLVCFLALASCGTAGSDTPADNQNSKATSGEIEIEKTISQAIISENPAWLNALSDCLSNTRERPANYEFLELLSKWIIEVDKRCSWNLPLNNKAKFFDDALSIADLTKIMACVWITEVTMRDGQDYPPGGFTGDKDGLLEFKKKTTPDQIYLNSMRVQNINIKGLVENWGVQFNTYPETETHFTLEQSASAGCMFMANCLNSIKKSWVSPDRRFNLRDMAGALWIWNPEPDCNESGGYWNMIMWQAFGDHFHTKYDQSGQKIPNDGYTFWSKNIKNEAYPRYVTFGKSDEEAIKYWMDLQSDARNMKP